ncbi:Protein of unknown function [Andreprevotia lacus DSM 23236]|jgi:hypothetical protein|uniref:DUF4240 domain-containing protein n=1 Tax=Andreprevotia lacus DSM 23236 TaxID=1121001 RepID=A0A1W1XA18_9NEIS|nr:DUF4240 domain-containing protein [Andreprevotia lacus]SMC20381.1 Protein of unknown function [Andreprevotia lacus DSM 23236]
MKHSQFWQIIAQSLAAADGDAETQLDTLRDALDALPADDILAFDRLFHFYHQRADRGLLWGAAYLIGGGCSDDGFMDFRGWLVARGQEVYEAALANPDSLADVPAVVEGDDGQIEGFLYLAGDAWLDKTDSDSETFYELVNQLPAGDDAPPPLPDDNGPEWEDDDLDALFPRLAALLEEA